MFEQELKVREAAKIADVNYQLVIRHIHEGKLPARKRLSEFRISVADFDKWAYTYGLRTNYNAVEL